MIHEGEEADLTLVRMNLTSLSNPENGGTPSIGFISASLTLIAIATSRKRNDYNNWEQREYKNYNLKQT